MTDLETTPAVPWFRQPLVWMLIGIPLSSVIMGVVIITLAVTSYDGLVVDDYYKRGLEINRVLDRDTAAVSAALDGTLHVDGAATLLILRSAHAGARLPDTVSLRLSYSTRAGLDRELTLTRTTSSDYRGSGVTLAPGRWYVEVGTTEWRLTGHIDASREGPVEVRAGG